MQLDKHIYICIEQLNFVFCKGVGVWLIPARANQTWMFCNNFLGVVESLVFLLLRFWSLTIVQPSLKNREAIRILSTLVLAAKDDLSQTTPQFHWMDPTIVSMLQHKKVFVMWSWIKLYEEISFILINFYFCKEIPFILVFFFEIKEIRNWTEFFLASQPNVSDPEKEKSRSCSRIALYNIYIS